MLTSCYIYLDWSTEQLDKHYKEIQSQLGNYFLRIASPRIAERAKGGAGPIPEALKRIFTDGASTSTSTSSASIEVEVRENHMENEELCDPNALLLRHTLALKGRVDTCMEELEAGNALAEIMAVLKVVSAFSTASFSPSLFRVSLPPLFGSPYPNPHLPTVNPYSYPLPTSPSFNLPLERLLSIFYCILFPSLFSYAH